MKPIHSSILLKIIFVFFLLSAAVIFWIWAISPFNSAGAQKKNFIVKRGESVDSISLRLQSEQLIRSKAVFKIVVQVRGLAKDIQAGEFQLSQDMSLMAIAQALTHGTSDIRVTLIEGLRREEIAEELAQRFASRGSTFAKQEFLRLTEAEEGFLFPDTYFLPINMPASEVVNLLKKTFAEKLNKDLSTAFSQKGFTKKQAVTLASMVEREARFDKDRPLVAGILIKRWKNQWPIQVDATVQYALGYQPSEKSWWKKSLTKADIELDSPYNTYKQIGLPPTPICNPSLASMQAVANSQPSDYWFYLSDNQGVLHYAKTIEEHNRNIEKYLQ